MKMLDFYRAVLSAGGLVANDEGYVSARFDDDTIPFMVRIIDETGAAHSKRLVLPMKQHVSNGDKSQIVLFHPLSENILRGESEVMAKFRQAVNVRLNFALASLVDELLTLATSPAMHSRLRPDQLELMSILKDADAKTLEAWQALTKAMPFTSNDSEKRFAHLYIKKNGLISGKRHLRVAIISFPFYDELKKADRTVYGVKLRKKDHEMLVAMVEHLLPNLDKPGFYNRGSVSDTSPTLEALLLGVLGVASHINSFVEEYGELLPNLQSLQYDDSWVEALQNVDQFRGEIRMLPMQTGNEGATDRQEAQREAAPALTNVSMAAPAPQLGQPRTVAMPPPAAPVAHHHAHAMAMPPMMAPSHGPQVGELVRSASGGIDLAATMQRMNPQMQQQFGNPAYGGYPMMPSSGPEALRDPRSIPAYERLLGPAGQPAPYGYGQPQGYGGYGAPQGYGGMPPRI